MVTVLFVSLASETAAILSHEQNSCPHQSISDFFNHEPNCSCDVAFEQYYRGVYIDDHRPFM